MSEMTGWPAGSGIRTDYAEMMAFIKDGGPMPQGIVQHGQNAVNDLQELRREWKLFQRGAMKHLGVDELWMNQRFHDAIDRYAFESPPRPGGPATGGGGGGGTGGGGTGGTGGGGHYGNYPDGYPGTGGTAQQRDAFAAIKAYLDDMGLGGLAEWAWNHIVNGSSDEVIKLDLKNQKQFQDRFWYVFERQKNGLPTMTVNEALNYEKQATTMMRAAGLDSSFWSGRKLGEMIAGDVSLDELQQRLVTTRQMAFELPEEVRAEFRRLYGINETQIAAYLLDPDTAEPLLARQAQAAQIAGAGLRAGVGGVSREEAERIGSLGYDAQRAGQVFSQIGQAQELFTPLVGQQNAERSIGRGEQFAAMFEGDAQARNTLERRQRSRQAVFESGGGFAANREGLSGVGSAR